MSIAARVLGISRVIDAMWTRLEVDPRARNQLRDTIHGILSDWVKGDGKTTGGRTLVVFIDDLDRCTDDVIVRVCEAVKLYLDAPGLIFVIGCDLSVIARGAAGAARGGVGEGRTYLEKIIQVSYRVPSPDRKAVRDLINGYGHRSGISHLLDPAVKDILAEASKRNPRQIKRIINSFVLEHHLDPAWRRAPLSSSLLITAILIQQLYPSFYAVLVDESSGDDPIGGFLDYATVYSRARIRPLVTMRGGRSCVAYLIGIASPHPAPVHFLSARVFRLMALRNCYRTITRSWRVSMLSSRYPAYRRTESQGSS